jgi:nickel/cobalt transporter (NicO) family protein
MLTAADQGSTFRRGEGTIRLRVQATLPRVSAGSHQLRFRNEHLAGHSTYLANALVPESARVTVTAQRRVSDQRELTIEYTLD